MRFNIKFINNVDKFKLLIEGGKIMNRRRELLKEKIINPYLNKKTEYIGVELEYPIIFKDRNVESKKLIADLFNHLKEKHHFKNEELDIDGNVVSVKNSFGDKVSLDYRYEVIEFAMQKDLNLNDIAERFLKIFEQVQKFLNEHNCFLTGMGTNLSDDATQMNLINTSFWNAFYNYQKKFTNYKKAYCFISNMQSIQTHLEIPTANVANDDGSTLLKGFNLFNKLEFVRALLFSNSLPNKTSIPENYTYPENVLCARDFNWDYSEFPRDHVDKKMHTLDELAEYLSKIKLYKKKIAHGFKEINGPTIEEYFSNPNQKDDVLDVFRYFGNVVLNLYTTLEIRSDCTQPLKDTFAPVAFNLGISRKLDEATAITEQFFKDNKIHHTNSELRRMAITDKKIVDDDIMRSYLQKLYNLAKAALEERGFGEEKHLLCLQERIDKLECPAKKQMRQLAQGTPLEDIIKQCAEL